MPTQFHPRAGAAFPSGASKRQSIEIHTIMKIDAIILRELQIMPLVRPFQTSFGVTRDRSPRIGPGRGSIRRPDTAGASARRASGRSSPASRPIRCWQVIVRSWVRCWPRSRLNTAAIVRDLQAWCAAIRMAKAALENAIWDLEAQREGVSLSQLLGGCSREHPMRRVAGNPGLDSGTDGDR
jgi:O-succinylbenzoate synthase